MTDSVSCTLCVLQIPLPLLGKLSTSCSLSKFVVVSANSGLPRTAESNKKLLMSPDNHMHACTLA